jgi:hypothetical protein
MVLYYRVDKTFYSNSKRENGLQATVVSRSKAQGGSETAQRIKAGYSFLNTKTKKR